jgi:hypothetical protein
MKTSLSSRTRFKDVKCATSLLVGVRCAGAVSGAAWIGDRAGTGFVDVLRWFRYPGKPVQTNGHFQHVGGV